MNSSNYVNFPLRISALFNIKIDDNFLFSWTIPVHLHSIADSKNGDLARVSIYRLYFDELNKKGFDFSNGFKCSYVHRFEELNDLSMNISKLNFYQDQNV